MSKSKSNYKSFILNISQNQYACTHCGSIVNHKATLCTCCDRPLTSIEAVLCDVVLNKEDKVSVLVKVGAEIAEDDAVDITHYYRQLEYNLVNSETIDAIKNQLS